MEGFEPRVFESDALAGLPLAFGDAPLSGLLKAAPEDFVVEEIPAVEFSGEGEHLILRLRKTGLNTVDVAARLAEWAGTPRSAIGFSGLKDRHAVATQYFSVCLAGRDAPDPARIEAPDLRVMAQTRHRHKLRRGELRGNRFVLRLSGIQGERAAAERRLRQIATHGVPNYFGPQRFGRGASNLIGAQALLRGRARRPRPERRRMLLSAARSFVFNQVLGQRVADGSWAHALPGEVVLRDGETRMLLAGEISPTLIERVQAMELHPSGPLPGRAGSCLWPEGEAVRRERRALDACALGAWVEALVRQRLDAARRALRLVPRELTWAWEGGDGLRLSFTLAPGCYATSLVRELMTERAPQRAASRPALRESRA